MTAKARSLQDFAGRWQLERIVTPAVGPVARFTGTAEWRPEEDALFCTEKGVLSLDGRAPMHAERRYRWKQDLMVFFDDGRFFHQVPACGGTAQHWCDPDQYVAEYDFTAWPCFCVTWVVKGPRKDYRSVTKYQRT